MEAQTPLDSDPQSVLVEADHVNDQRLARAQEAMWNRKEHVLPKFEIIKPGVVKVSAKLDEDTITHMVRAAGLKTLERNTEIN